MLTLHDRFGPMVNAPRSEHVVVVDRRSSCRVHPDFGRPQRFVYANPINSGCWRLGSRAVRHDEKVRLERGAVIELDGDSGALEANANGGSPEVPWRGGRGARPPDVRQVPDQRQQPLAEANGRAG